MNITITNRRFAVRALLLCLALLVASVSSCAPLNTYSGRPFTPAAVRYNSIDTTADRAAFLKRSANINELKIRAADLAIKAIDSSSAETLAAAGAMLLSACQAELELVRDGSLSLAAGKIDPKKDSNLANYIAKKEQRLLHEDLILAEKIGADTRALGKIYYDYARLCLTMIHMAHTSGIKDSEPFMVTLHNDLIICMRKAQARGIAEAAAYLRTH